MKTFDDLIKVLLELDRKDVVEALGVFYEENHQDFRDRVENMAIEEVIIAPRAPWQNPYVERLIGSIRRECLDHVIVFGQDHLRRILSEYFTYHHEARLHLSLDRNSPIPRSVCPPEQGRVVAKEYLGGLHHCYTRAA